jgi:hypothetical protein
MVYLLTYDHPHRKTQDLLFRFKMAGVDLHVLATPWIERKNFVPLFKVKPDDLPWYPKQICNKLGYKFDRIELTDVVAVGEATDFVPFSGEVVAIGGAGILKAAFVQKNTVINSHCGYLPFVRGLDALKWAICLYQPIGVTTHVIDESCDGGKMIEREVVPLYPQDDLFSIAMRQYGMELDMLVDAVANEKWKHTTPFDPAHFKNPHRRMGHSRELQMIERLKRNLIDMAGNE